MSGAILAQESPVVFEASLSDFLDVRLLVKRDDLLPFPLAGNKVRKLTAEFASVGTMPELVITNGAVNSNHCRTLAIMAARAGVAAHCVLHGDAESASSQLSLTMLRSLGCTFEVVEPSQIAIAIDRARLRAEDDGAAVRVIAGGCHTPAGARAYLDIGLAEFSAHQPDVVVVASGTGATQGGLAAAAARSLSSPRVIGVSVARDVERGIAPVREAAAWAGAPEASIEFLDGYRDGGYGRWTQATQSSLDLAWKHGLLVDHTYTAKAFAALVDRVTIGDIPRGSTVLFWHTGGLWNYLAAEL